MQQSTCSRCPLVDRQAGAGCQIFWCSATFPLFQSPQLLHLPLSFHCEGSLEKSTVIWFILYFLMQPLPLLTQRLPSCSAGFGAVLPESPLNAGDKWGICPSRWGTRKADLGYIHASCPCWNTYQTDPARCRTSPHQGQSRTTGKEKEQVRARSELVKLYGLSRLKAWVNAITKMMTRSKEEFGIILQWKFPSSLNPTGGKRKCML